MGRKAKLRQQRKTESSPFCTTYTPVASDLRKLWAEDPEKTFKFLGVTMVLTNGKSEAANLINSLPSVQRIKAMMLSDDEVEKHYGGVVMSFLSFGLFAELWLELELGDLTFLRSMIVELSHQEFILDDHRRYFNTTTQEWTPAVSVISALLNSFSMCVAAQSYLHEENKLHKCGLNTGVVTEAFRTHLITEVPILTGQTFGMLFHQGRVCLYTTTNTLTGKSDMTLAIQSEDGFWSYCPDLHKGRTPIKDLAALREWVSQYDGPTLTAKTISHRSAKLLKWLGFEVVELNPLGVPREVIDKAKYKHMDGTYLADFTSMAVSLRARHQKTPQNDSVREKVVAQ